MRKCKEEALLRNAIGYDIGQCMACCSIFGMVMPKFYCKGGNDVIGN